MKLHRALSTIAAAMTAAALLLPMTGGAGDRHDQDRARDALRRGEALPLARILDITGRAVPGDVIKVELETKRGKLIYELKVLDASGHVKEIKLDAYNGAVLKIEDDDD